MRIPRFLSLYVGIGIQYLAPTVKLLWIHIFLIDKEGVLTSSSLEVKVLYYE